MSRGDNVREILGAIGPFWAKWGCDESRAECEFFVLIETTFRQLRNGRFSPNLANKRISMSPRWIREDILADFHLKGHLPQNLKSKIGQTGTSLRAGYRSRDALQIYCVLRVVVQLRPREFPRSVNFSVRRTVVELWGVEVAQFSDFGLFSPYKTPKTYLLVTSLEPRGYIAEWLRFFRVVVEGPKGCRPVAMFSCDFW